MMKRINDDNDKQYTSRFTPSVQEVVRRGNIVPLDLLLR